MLNSFFLPCSERGFDGLREVVPAVPVSTSGKLAVVGEGIFRRLPDVEDAELLLPLP